MLVAFQLHWIQHEDAFGVPVELFVKNDEKDGRSSN